MCGINFILDKKKQLNDLPIQRMNEAIIHRGREHSAWHCHEETDRQLFFGHNRLKIIDLEDRANQPMHSPDGRYMLVFNGEIYNYQTLKQPLQKQFEFVTASDSEVLMYYLAAHKATIGEEVNGIFAFVWYDTYTKTLSYARDSMGVKPLYQYEDDCYLILSSEIRGILASGLVKKELDVSQIYHYLAYRYAEPDKTFFQGIKPVSPIPPPKYLPQNITIDTFSSYLSKAVATQTVGEVPFGLFLSGGVDSTLLLALLYEQGYANLLAFTIANTGVERNFGTDDFYFSKLAAKQFGANLQTVEVDATFLQGLPAFVQTIDQPIADVAYWLTQTLAQEARKSVKFVLSGAGADELFAGYNRHQAFYFYQKYYGALMLAYPFLKIGGANLPTGFEHPFRKKYRLLKKFAKDITYSKSKTWDNFIRLGIGWGRGEAEDISAYFNPLIHDQQNYLQHDILVLNDRAGMYHALEIRVPYLDNDIVRYANSLSFDFKLKNGKKWLLKQILDSKGGKIYTQRRKEGFGIPVGKWLRESAGKDYIALLQSPTNILQNYVPNVLIQRILKQHIAQKHDYSSELWAILLLEMWLRKF